MEEASYTEFEKLFRQHHQGLCDLACNIVRDPDAAKDIVQEVFYKLWKNRETLKLEDQIKHYLFKATAHTSLNHLRFNKKIIRFGDDNPLKDMIAPAAMEAPSHGELELHVRNAIDKLPPKCKTIFILSRHEGMKYQEIAENLELSLKTVENQMGIALRKLREELKPYLTFETVLLILAAALTLYFIFS